MDISKYPITTPFGWVNGYPLNLDPVNHPGQGYHNGIDYGLPMGTPVIVNGVTIGLSNNTGASTGPHLHVGKYVDGKVQDPGLGNGFNFDNAVVFDTGHDAVNGNFVRISADGALWNYLHLESILVSAGQKLEGAAEDNMIQPTVEEVNALFEAFGGDPPNATQLGYYPGRDINVLYYDLIKASKPSEQDVTNAFQKILGATPNEAQLIYYPQHLSLVLYRDLANAKAQQPIPVPAQPVPQTGFTQQDRATANETNTLIQQIWLKISSIFK